ncbi:hypothetical protein SK128_007939 [Halocaridina rubra]|uniref:Uncharacterized protein n=1 Tax=Halocaridina rubra TaxID=373956 RepID=A0AAN8XES5_HALRR
MLTKETSLKSIVSVTSVGLFISLFLGSVSDVPPASSCHELYKDYNVFLYGEYIVQEHSEYPTVTVVCDIEGRDFCNGSLLHGSQNLVSDMYDNTQSLNLVESLNKLSPYGETNHPLLEIFSGVLKINFTSPVLIHSVFVNGTENEYITKFMLSYEYLDEVVTNATHNSTYYYSGIEYGAWEVIDSTLGVLMSLRPFVANSVTLHVEEFTNLQRLRLDFIGCLYNATAEFQREPSGPFGCYLWPSSVNTLIAKGPQITAFTITYHPVYVLSPDVFNQPILPLGKAPDESVCSSLDCGILAQLPGLQDYEVCNKSQDFLDELTSAPSSFSLEVATRGCAGDPGQYGVSIITWGLALTI